MQYKREGWKHSWSKQEANSFFCATQKKGVQSYVGFPNSIVNLCIILHCWKKRDILVFLLNEWIHCHILMKCEAVTATGMPLELIKPSGMSLLFFSDCYNIGQPLPIKFINVSKICKVILGVDISSASIKWNKWTHCQELLNYFGCQSIYSFSISSFASIWYSITDIIIA